MKDNVSEAVSLENNSNNQANTENLIPIKRLIDGVWQELLVNNEEFSNLMAMADKGELDETNFQIGWFENNESEEKQDLNLVIKEMLEILSEKLEVGLSGEVEASENAPAA